MSQPTLKFFAILRLVDGVILSSECKQNESLESYSTEVKMLTKRISGVDLEPDDRQKVKSQNGTWYVTLDEKRIYYAVLTETNYPERHAYGFIHEVILQLQQLDDYYIHDAVTVKNHTKKFLPGLFEKYCDLKKVDKLYVAQEHVEQIKETMAQNIKQVMENTKNLEKLDEKTRDFKDLAKDYYENADELEKATRQTKQAMIIVASCIMGCIGLVVLVYAV